MGKNEDVAPLDDHTTRVCHAAPNIFNSMTGLIAMGALLITTLATGETDVKRVCTCSELSNKVNEVRFTNKEIDLDYKLSA